MILICIAQSVAATSCIDVSYLSALISAVDSYLLISTDISNRYVLHTHCCQQSINSFIYTDIKSRYPIHTDISFRLLLHLNCYQHWIATSSALLSAVVRYFIRTAISRPTSSTLLSPIDNYCHLTRRVYKKDKHHSDWCKSWVNILHPQLYQH